MPNSKLPLIYWDANIPLAYINGESQRLAQIEGLMRESGKTLQIVTSVVSIVEVAWGKVEQDGKALDADVEQKINSLWDLGSPIELVEFYELIAEEAKVLMRKGVKEGWSLKPLDAIHLATADRIRATAFHTYDNQKLSKFSALTKTNFPVTLPVANQSVLIPGPPPNP